MRIKRFLWPALTVLLLCALLASLLIDGRGCTCGGRCAMCWVPDLTYEVEGEPVGLIGGVNVKRAGALSREAVLTEITRLPVTGRLADYEHAAVVVLERRRQDGAVGYYIAAALPEGGGSCAATGTNALFLGENIVIQDIRLTDGVIWLTLLNGAQNQETVQVYCHKGRLYFTTENPAH